MKQYLREGLPLFIFLLVGYLLIGLQVEAGGILRFIPECYGSIFGYDNYAYSVIPPTLVMGKHPLACILYSLPRQVLQHFFSYNTVLIFEIVLRSALVAATICIIHYYCRHIVGLKKTSSLLLALLLAGCFTSMLLSFTIDLYTFSFFTLALAVTSQTKMLTAENRHHRQELNITRWAILLGAITATNVFKPLAVAILLPTNFSRRIRIGVRSGFFAAGFFLIVFLPIYIMTKRHVYREADKAKNISAIFPDILETKDSPEFRYPILPGRNALDFVGNNYRGGIERFFAHPILWPDFQLVNDTAFVNDITYPNHLQAPDPEPLYEHPYKLYYGLIIWGIALSSIWFLRRNRKVLLLGLYLGIDIGIHLIAGFGINEAALYSAHWLFLLPLLLAWIVSAIGKKFAHATAQRRAVVSILIDVMLLSAVSLQLSVNLPLVSRLFTS